MEYWIFQQKGKAKINADRIRLLDAIGFEWDPQRVQWQAMYDKLALFVRKHGHAKVPKGYSEDKELANWVRNQRLEHRNWEQQKRSRMTPERFNMLDKLGFIWSQSTAAAAAAAAVAPGRVNSHKTRHVGVHDGTLPTTAAQETRVEPLPLEEEDDDECGH